MEMHIFVGNYERYFNWEKKLKMKSNIQISFLMDNDFSLWKYF